MSAGVELCLPWDVTDDGDDHVIASVREPVEIARIPHGQGADDLAAFIVRAANEHIGLTRALHRVEGEAKAQRARAEAEEAEGARLRRQMETAPPWDVSDPPTDDEMHALRMRWAFGPEKYQADADALIAAVIHGRAENARLTRERDAALADVARLRAIVEGRTVAPTPQEIGAHHAAGGWWMLWAGEVAHTLGRDRAERAARSQQRGTSGASYRWHALDATGRPCAWPTAPDAATQRAVDAGGADG